MPPQISANNTISKRGSRNTYVGPCFKHLRQVFVNMQINPEAYIVRLALLCQFGAKKYFRTNT